MGQPILAADIDHTLIRGTGGSLLTLALKIASRSGLAAPEIYDGSEARALRSAWGKGEISQQEYETELYWIFDRGGGFRGVSLEKLREVGQTILSRYQRSAYLFPQTLLAVARRHEYFRTAISGSATELVDAVVGDLFDHIAGTVWETEDGIIQSAKLIVDPIGDGKDTILRSIAAMRGLSLDGSIAIGDSNSDACMLRAVEHPIAFNPDPRLQEIARQEGWLVVTENSTSHAIHCRIAKGDRRRFTEISVTEYLPPLVADNLLAELGSRNLGLI